MIHPHSVERQNPANHFAEIKDYYLSKQWFGQMFFCQEWGKEQQKSKSAETASPNRGEKAGVSEIWEMVWASLPEDLIIPMMTYAKLVL